MSSLAITNLFSVDGQVVLVTGGGTGLGRMIATAFAVNGAKVYITGRRADVLKRTAREVNEVVKGEGGKGSVVPIQGDVSSKVNVKALHEKVAALEEKLDTLVNCAGIAVQMKGTAQTDHDNVKDVQQLLESVEEEDFTTSNAVNVAGPYFMTTAFAPMLMKSDNGNVINIASIAPLHLQRKFGSVTYSVSKGAATTLSSQLASRLIPYGIRVNCLCPGLFPSEITGDGTTVSPGVQKQVSKIPKGRPGQAEEIAGPCIMLASAAGAYMNNAVLVIDGGRLMTVSANT